MNGSQKLSKSLLLFIILFISTVIAEASSQHEQHNLETGVTVCKISKEEEARKVQAVMYNNYCIKYGLNEYDSLVYNNLSITKDAKSLFNDDFIIGMASGQNLQPVYNISDIKDPILIVDGHTGGAHCCYNTLILELGEKFSTLAEFHGGDSPVNIQKLENTPEFKITLRDWAYKHLWTSLASSYAPKVILDYTEEKTLFAKEEMRKNELLNEKLQNLVNKINSYNYSNFKYAYKDNIQDLSNQEAQANELYFGKLLEPLLDLIYSGHARQARELIENTWPSNASSKKMFMHDLVQAIKNSAYYNDLVIVNNLSSSFDTIFY